jgi:diguanylate cyclase (GGDEF)-like protein
VTLARAAEVLVAGLARVFDAPVALLSRDSLGWRFEAQAFPAASGSTALPLMSDTMLESVRQVHSVSGEVWTVLAVEGVGERDWTLLLPGSCAVWSTRPGFDELVDRIKWSVGEVATREREDYTSRLERRLHAFNRRLAREQIGARLNSLVLRTVAAQVDARTASLAIFDEAENGLIIVAALGYPLSIVEHIRIPSGEGLIGGAHASGKSIAGSAQSTGLRRIRYHTDSYLILPMLAGHTRLGVIALTDRGDGCPFDRRDFAAARLFVSAAASAFGRERLRARLAEVTELATVDSVTALFNRRYFETRLEAEIERARRQQQDLAVLLIDIDDFKRVNDTRGHLEGDRILREVAGVLRAGVRIFDVCARYGGEEFVIVMPAATEIVARQVAERIRLNIEQSFSHDRPLVTVSVGGAMLSDGGTANELVDLADRALIRAKKSGKNQVWLTSQPPARK